MCHYCDYEIAAPPICPACRFEGIRYGGLGTQRLEAEVLARFPGVSVLRMDSDTMRSAAATRPRWTAFARERSRSWSERR